MPARGEGGLSSWKIALIAYCTYLVICTLCVTCLNALWFYRQVSFAAAMDRFFEHLGFTMVVFGIGSLFTLLVLTYGFGPAILRRYLRSDRTMAWIYFLILEVHGVIVVQVVVQVLLPDELLWSIFISVTIGNVVLLIWFLLRPDLHGHHGLRPKQAAVFD